MSNASEEPGTGTDDVVGVGDDQLPPDLVAGEENPLAEGLPDGESADLEGGKVAEEMDSEDGSRDGSGDDSRDGDRS